MSEMTGASRDRLPCVLLFLCIPWLMVESFLLVNVYESDLLAYSLGFQIVKYFLLLFPPLYWIFNNGVDWRWLRLLLMVFAVVGVYVLVSFYCGVGLEEISISIKNVYFWVFYFLLICSARVDFGGRALGCFLWGAAFFLVVNVAYSIFVDFSFEGVDGFYFFDFYKLKGIFNEWDFMRGGEVRAFGLMGSPLTLSQTLIVALCFSLVGAGRVGLRKELIFFVALFLVFLLGMYLTRTRNPLVGVFCAFLLLFCGRFFGFSRRTIFFFFGAIYFVVVFLVFEMGRRGMGDLSSQARVPMILEFLGLIAQNPLGFGVGSTGVSLTTYKYFFESSAATVFMDLGVVGGVLFWGVLFKALYFLWVGSRCGGGVGWMQKSVFLSLAALLFMTNFSNIFDSSLLVYSILVAIGVKAVSPSVGAVQS